MSLRQRCCARHSIALLITAMALFLVPACSSAAAATLGGTVTGQTFDAGPEPLAEVKVAVADAGGEILAATETDSSGGYSLEIPPGVYDVSFEPPSGAYEPTTIHDVEALGSQTLNVLLLRAEKVQLTGTIRDHDGNPVPQAQVTAAGPIASDVTQAGPDGTYSIAVQPGSYKLVVETGKSSAPGLPGHWAVTSVSFPVEADLQQDITLPPTSLLTVQVLGKEDEPIAGALVSTPQANGSGDLGGLAAEHVRTLGDLKQTDVDGRARFAFFDGGLPTDLGAVTPPAGSPYGYAQFEIPPIEGDATLAVSFGGDGEEPKDTTPPQLQGLALEPDQIDTSATKRSVAVFAQVADESGLKDATVLFVSPNGEASTSGAEPELVSGTPTSGTFRILVTFDQGSEAGPWNIAVITLADQSGNEVEVPRVELDAAELPHTVTVVPQPPAVSGLAPSAGPEAGGTEVTISGSGFGGASEVQFGATPAASFEVVSDSSITAISPAGTGTVDVTVTTLAGASETGAAARFAYGPPVSLSSSPNPSQDGQKATFTAKVKPEAGSALAPTGTVAFVEGGTTLAVDDLKNGTARFKTSSLSIGDHEVTAVYSGDSYFGPSGSATITQTVRQRGSKSP